MAAVLDTSVIIELARGNEEVRQRVLESDKEFYITTITKFELLVGLPKKDELMWLDFLERLPFDDKASEVAAYLFRELRKSGKPMALKDLLIGSICIANNMRLITLDRDFEVLQDFGLQVEFL